MLLAVPSLPITVKGPFQVVQMEVRYPPVEARVLAACLAGMLAFLGAARRCKEAAMKLSVEVVPTRTQVVLLPSPGVAAQG